MNFRPIYICLISLFLYPGQSYAQSLDSLLRQLPSRAGAFEPQALADSSLIASDNSRSVLLEYLREGIASPNSYPTTLPVLVGLPRVLRPVQATQALAIVAPKLVLNAEAKGAMPEIERLLEGYRLARQIEVHTLQQIQDKTLGQSLFTSQSLAASREQLRTQALDMPNTQIFSDKLKPNSIKHYADRISVSEIERKYWLWGFESSVQFSQNYISDNWHKGGNSNLNLSMRNYLSLLYSKGKVQWLGEIESKLGLYSADVERQTTKYRISEDRLRLHSNYGIKINKRWSYTLDGELRTQLFNIYNPSRTKLHSAPLAPVRSNLGVGLQYTYQYKSKERYGRKFKIAVNFAPFSHNWRWSQRRDIDLARHGFKDPNKLSVHSFGSTLRGQMQWDINMDLSWASRVYFNTSYHNVEAEWENTLTMRISRYFSTRINLQLRFDDSAKPSEAWHRYLQINELLSFGFNYKL